MSIHSYRPTKFGFKSGVRVSGKPSGGPVRAAPRNEPSMYPKMHGGRGKAERQLNMVLCLKSMRGRSLAVADVYDIPRLDDDASLEAREKRWDRDKNEMRYSGLDISYRRPGHYSGEGYTVTVEPPPTPDEILAAPNHKRPECKLRGLNPAQRYFQILYLVETGTKPTVASLATYLHVTQGTVLEDIAALSCCCSGRLPHEYLYAQVEDGVVTISGPRLYT